RCLQSRQRRLRSRHLAYAAGAGGLLAEPPALRDAAAAHGCGAHRALTAVLAGRTTDAHGPGRQAGGPQWESGRQGGAPAAVPDPCAALGLRDLAAASRGARPGLPASLRADHS
ncbi:unnamed protein product, partial [Effrenium voratum]